MHAMKRWSMFICESAMLLMACLTALSAGMSPGPADWMTEPPGVLAVESGVIRVKDRPAVLKDFKGDGYRLTFRARCVDGGKLGQIWFSPHYQGEFQRYAIALRSGLLNDLFLLRYRESDFPESTVGIANCYPLGFEPDAAKWNKFRLEVRGGWITVWAGDVTHPQLDYRDPQPLSGGGVALGGSWHTCEFADVKIEPLDPQSDPSGDGMPSSRAPAIIRIACGAKGHQPPAGYALTSGEPYAVGRAFGWDRELKTARTRLKTSDPLLRGVLRLDAAESAATLRVPVPNGDYYVTVGGGDAEGYCQWRVALEGHRFADARLLPMEFIDEARRVTVSDGFCDITLESIADQPRGVVNVLNYVVIEPWASVAGPLPDMKARRAEQRAGYQSREISAPSRRASACGSPRMVETNDQLPRLSKDPQASINTFSENHGQPQAAALRNCINLDGPWLFMPEQDLAPNRKPESPSVGDDDWHVISVPSFWNPNGWWIYTGERRAGESYTAREMARVNAQTFDWKATKVGWYRQWLTLEQPPVAGRRYALRFQASASVTDVYCNGMRVGGHTGMFAPFEVDLTPQLKQGKNLVAVRVVGEMEKNGAQANKVLDQMITMIVTPEHVGSLPRGIIYSTIRDLQGRPTNERPGGLWQPVTLVVSDEARIEDYFFRARTDGAEIDVEVANGGTLAWTGAVAVAVAGARDEKPVAVAAGGLAKVTLSVRSEALKLWRPGEPNLYPMEITLVSVHEQLGRAATPLAAAALDGASALPNARSSGYCLVDRRERQVGFRTAEVRGDKFYLNGQPYWLGGANAFPHGLMPNDTALAEKAMGILAKNNIRINRSHGTPMPRAWLDAANRQGVGISLEGGWPWVLASNTEIPDAKLWRAFVAEMRDLVRDLRNEPSILVWTVSNENHIDWDKDDARRLKKWRLWESVIKMIREEDPTRPVCAFSGHERVDNRHAKVSTSKDPRDYYENFMKKNSIDDGDFTDEHRYIGHYSPSILNYEYRSQSRNLGMGLAVWTQEAATGYPNNDTGHLERKYIKEYVPQAWVGHDAYDHRDPSAYIANVGFMTKEWMEKVRRDRNTAGWQMFNSGNWFRHPYDAATLEPYPILDAARLSLQPVLPSLEMRDRHAIAGNTVSGTLYVINDANDGRSLSGVTCEVALTDGTRAILVSTNVSVANCPYFGKVTVQVALTIPQRLPREYGVYPLTLTLREQGKVIADNRYDLLVGTPEWAKGNNTPTVGVTGIDRKIGAILKNLGVAIDPATPEKHPVWLWADRKVPSADSKQGRKLLEYVERGGRLILLETGAAEALLPGVILKYDRQEYLFPEYVDMLLPGHYAFAGLGPHDLKWWNGEGDRSEVCRKVYVVNRKAEGVSVPTQYIEPHIGKENWAKAFRSPFFTVKRGKGEIVVCELRVSAGNTDPVARRVLANVLRCGEILPIDSYSLMADP